MNAQSHIDKQISDDSKYFIYLFYFKILILKFVNLIIKKIKKMKKK